MLSLKVSVPVLISTLVLSVYAVQFERLDTAYAQLNSTLDSTTSESSMGSDIVLLSQKLKKESFGGRNIIGQVKNIGHETADYVLIHLTVYSRDGEVISTAESYAEPSTLKAGQKINFRNLW